MRIVAGRFLKSCGLAKLKACDLLDIIWKSKPWNRLLDMKRAATASCWRVGRVKGEKMKLKSYTKYKRWYPVELISFNITFVITRHKALGVTPVDSLFLLYDQLSLYLKNTYFFVGHIAANVSSIISNVAKKFRLHDYVPPFDCTKSSPDIHRSQGCIIHLRQC